MLNKSVRSPFSFIKLQVFILKQRVLFSEVLKKIRDLKHVLRLPSFLVKFTKKRKFLGFCFLFIGLFSAGLILFLQLKEENQVMAVSSEPIVASSEFNNNQGSGIKRILIPNLSLDLPVTPSKIIDGYWETSETTASHGEGSANPGDKNNIVVFAHAREGLFINLRNIQKDTIIYLLTNNRWYRYKVIEIQTVYPHQIETVTPTNYEVLTLFTCSGFFDEKRLIVKALPF